MATVRYLGIVPQGEPSDQMGPDDQGRAQIVFNILALKRPSATFVDELLGTLEAAGVGTSGVNMFGGSQVAIPGPENAGPFLIVRATPGTAPLGTHSEGRAYLRQPGAQILVHALVSADAEAMAEAAYVALAAVSNQDVTVPA